MFEPGEVLSPTQALERRCTMRIRSFLGGKVLFINNAYSADCLIRNLSQYGAKITVTGSDMYPANPVLVVLKYGLAFETSTIWTAKRDAGLAFIETFNLAESVPTYLTHARRLWVDNLPR